MLRRSMEKDLGPGKLTPSRITGDVSPIITYNTIKPYLEDVQRGNYKAFLHEEPSSWVLTRGSTGDRRFFLLQGGICVRYLSAVHGRF